MSILIAPFKMNPLHSAVLAAALLITLPVHADSDKARISADTSIKPVATLTAQESQALSLAAGRILLHTDNARVALAIEDKKVALNEVNQGLKLVKVIEKALPKYIVTTTITNGDVTYNAEEEVSKNLVPIFNEQYIEDVIAPVAQAKTKKIKGTGRDTGKAPFIEDYSVLKQSTMKLNIAMAAEALTLAKQELDKGHFSNADMTLAALQVEGVIFEFNEIELPLTEAADDLKLAQLEVSEGKISQAKATLKRASDNLKEYEAIAGDSRAKEVRELQKEIDKMASSLAKGNHSESALKKIGQDIASYWERVVKWFK